MCHAGTACTHWGLSSMIVCKASRECCPLSGGCPHPNLCHLVTNVAKWALFIARKRQFSCKSETSFNACTRLCLIKAYCQEVPALLGCVTFRGAGPTAPEHPELGLRVRKGASHGGRSLFCKLWLIPDTERGSKCPETEHTTERTAAGTLGLCF